MKKKKLASKVFFKFKKEVLNHSFVYLALLIILLGGFIIRIYRVDQILGFYFDQGRDALVIWKLIHEGKPFLIGPTTGIAGIFRGPFYYYLITPFYLFGRGDPIYPAIFLSFLTVVANALMFYLGKKMHSYSAGLLAAFIGSFSFNLMLASRWLSNPTPMLLLSLLLVWMMLLVTEGKKWVWPVISFLAGLSLFHFGSSGEFFYFPAIFIFLLWQRKYFPERRLLILSILALLFTCLPLIAFDIKHQGILRQNIIKLFVGDRSFKGVTKYIFDERMAFYYDVFTNKIFHGRYMREIRLLIVIAAGFFVFLPKFLKNTGIKILLLLLLSPLIGLLFFQGNYGNIYDYYMTGYYLIFILLFALVLAEIGRYIPGKLFVVYFLFVFISGNWDVTKYKITAGVDGPETIMFGNQKQAIDWVYQDAGSEDFNVDVYVPPVISYAYDYLFIWYGQSTYGRSPLDTRTELLYTLREVDTPHPERLQAWLDRQKGIGKVEKTQQFGGITVERRKRL